MNLGVLIFFRCLPSSGDQALRSLGCVQLDRFRMGP